MALYLIRNCAIVDAMTRQMRPGHDVLIDRGRIRAVSAQPLAAQDCWEIDAGGRTLIPGLIDAHVWVTLTDFDAARLRHTPASLRFARASQALRAMLERGFTTVRDAGGADWGLRQAIADGLIVGPRLFVSGRALSPTGGAADIYARSVEQEAESDGESTFVRRADGREELLRAARAELGADVDQLTVTISGGSLKHVEAFDTARCTLDELEALVREAEACQRPVSALSYGDRAVSLAVRAGCRSIMHGAMLSAAGAAFMAERSVALVPVLAEHQALRERAQALGCEIHARDAAKALKEAAARALEHATAAGVEIGFGSAQWGAAEAQQGREWAARAALMEPYDALVSATAVNARILGMEGELGIVAPGAIADLLIVDGDPLRDVHLLGAHGRHLALIMKEGRIHRNRLETAYRQAAVVPAGPPMG